MSIQIQWNATSGLATCISFLNCLNFTSHWISAITQMTTCWRKPVKWCLYFLATGVVYDHVDKVHLKVTDKHLAACDKQRDGQKDVESDWYKPLGQCRKPWNQRQIAGQIVSKCHSVSEQEWEEKRLRHWEGAQRGRKSQRHKSSHSQRVFIDQI